MKMSKRIASVFIAGAIVVGGFELAERLEIPGAHSLVPTAEARVGRPLTPVSVGGVARRSTRRCAAGVTCY